MSILQAFSIGFISFFLCFLANVYKVFLVKIWSERNNFMSKYKQISIENKFMLVIIYDYKNLSNYLGSGFITILKTLGL